MRRALYVSAITIALVQVAPGVAAEPAAAAKRLLFLTHAGLYKHESLRPAEEALTRWGPASGFEVTALQGYGQARERLDFTFVTRDYLSGFDGLAMMTNGNLPMEDGQRRGLLEFVRQGGGFIGIHCASLTFYNDPAFGEMLGGYFLRPVAQNRRFVLKVEDSTHPATRMLGPSWSLIDEFYLFGTAAWDAARPEENVDALFGHRIPVGFSRQRVTVLLSLDAADPSAEGLAHVRPGGDYPQAWCRPYGEGRSFYTALGHRSDLWTDNPLFRDHLIGGIRWALRLEP